MDTVYSLIVGGRGPRAGVRRMHLVYADARLLARTNEADGALDALESHARLQVAERARGRVCVHAGVVGWAGRAILIPGPSHSGKSRLVHALVKAGATYYSDEYAVVDGLGRVHPFPAALSLRPSAQSKARRVEAVELGGHARLPPLRVGLVVATRYQPSGARRMRRTSSGAGVLALLANAVPARLRPAEVLARLVQVIRGAGVLRGARGEAEDAARQLLALHATWPERRR